MEGLTMLGIELPLYKGKGIPPAFTIISQAVGFVVSNRVARLQVKYKVYFTTNEGFLRYKNV